MFGIAGSAMTACMRRRRGSGAWSGEGGADVAVGEGELGECELGLVAASDFQVFGGGEGFLGGDGVERRGEAGLVAQGGEFEDLASGARGGGGGGFGAGLGRERGLGLRGLAGGGELETLCLLFGLFEAKGGGADFGVEAAAGPEGDLECGAKVVGGDGRVGSGAEDTVVGEGGELGPAGAAGAVEILFGGFDAFAGGVEVGALGGGVERGEAEFGFGEFTGHGGGEEFFEGGAEEGEVLFGGDLFGLLDFPSLSVAGEVELGGGAGFFAIDGLGEEGFGGLEAGAGGAEAALGLEGFKEEGDDGGLGLFADGFDIAGGGRFGVAGGADGGEQGEVDDLLGDDGASVEGAERADAGGEAGEDEADALQVTGLAGGGDEQVGLGEVAGAEGVGLGAALEKAEARELDARVLLGGEFEGGLESEGLGGEAGGGEDQDRE